MNNDPKKKEQITQNISITPLTSLSKFKSKKFSVIDTSRGETRPTSTQSRITLSSCQNTPQISDYSSSGKKGHRRSVIGPIICAKLTAMKIMNANQKELTRKVLEKKRVFELNQLSKERAKLKKSLLIIKDPKSIEILAMKIFHINNRISRLMKELNGEIIPSDFDINKKISLDNDLITLNDIDFSSMKEDMKKIDCYLKINEILHQCNLMELTTAEGVIKEKPSFYFQREKKQSLYEPCTEFGINKKTRNRSSIFIKAFRPFGFRTQKDEIKPVTLPSSFEDVYFELEEKRKLQNIKQHTETEPNKEEDFNDFLFLTTSTKKTSSRPKTERKSKSSQMQNKMNKILNNTKLIKESIKGRTLQETKAFKKANYNNLLKLSERIHKPKKKKKVKEVIKTDEELFIEAMEKIPGACKEAFRETFKKIMAEDRILNKPDPRVINPFDQKLKYLKEQKEFQKQAFKTMYVLRENIENGKEDDIFKDQRVFDDFENLDSLEWLIKKKNILEKRNKLVGAYNPKEKLVFNINYP